MRFALAVLTILAGLFVAPPRPLAAEPAFVRVFAEGDTFAVQSSDSRTGPDTPFAIASLGKTFTAVAVLRLVERGALSLNDPVAAHVPPERAAGLSGLDRVRLRHLLTMSSGLPEYYTGDFVDAALADPDRAQRPAAALRAAAQERALFPPGRDFDYSNTNYVLLGLVIEAATGLPYARAIETEVFAPAGLTDSFVFGARPLPPDFARGHAMRALMRRYYAGEGFGDGGIVASARDVVRFYTALFDDRVLLSDASVAAMLTDPHGAGYGMGIEIEDSIVGHSGGDLGYSADVRMELESGAVAVVLVAEEDGDIDWAWDRLTGR